MLGALTVELAKDMYVATEVVSKSIDIITINTTILLLIEKTIRLAVIVPVYISEAPRSNSEPKSKGLPAHLEIGNVHRMRRTSLLEDGTILIDMNMKCVSNKYSSLRFLTKPP